MPTCKTTEGSTWQLGKPGICELTEFKTNSKIFTRPVGKRNNKLILTLVIS